MAVLPFITLTFGNFGNGQAKFKECILDRGKLGDYDGGEEVGFLKHSDTCNAVVNCVVSYCWRLYDGGCFLLFFFSIAIIC